MRVPRIDEQCTKRLSLQHGVDCEKSMNRPSIGSQQLQLRKSLALMPARLKISFYTRMTSNQAIRCWPLWPRELEAKDALVASTERPTVTVLAALNAIFTQEVSIMIMI
jgi:hypothetical protein